MATDEDNLTKRVADKVSHRIAKADLNRNKFARDTGFAPSTLKRRLEGRNPGFSVHELDIIAQELGVDASEFFAA